MNIILHKISILMEPVNFGKKLIRIRKLKGLTQGDVAEKCNVTVRTIQRIESGEVTPRASTIKLISESLGFDFFETSITGTDVIKKIDSPELEDHTFLWYLKDLFNLKTNAMRKISILSSSVLLITFLFVSLLSVNAQSDNPEFIKSLVIERNPDNSVQRVEAAFSHRLNLDSLVQIRKDLQAIDIVVNYKKLEFDIHGLLASITFQVISNDGFSGTLEIKSLDERSADRRVGFYRDYTSDAKSPFGTGALPKNSRSE